MYEISWDEIYKLAKKYYELYGNIEVPYEYCIEYKDFTVCLGAWIKRQRELKKRNKLSNLQINLLEEISIEWHEQTKVKKVLSWNDIYEFAKEYYEEHGNLLIPHSYEIKYKNEKINLGSWINTQRAKYKGKVKPELEQYQVELLEKIGMVWHIIPYKHIVNFLEKQYMLYEKNKLRENDIIKLLKDGAFVYGDSGEILKADSLKFYRKNLSTNKNK